MPGAARVGRGGNEIVKAFVRRDFMGAISFVHAVADAAEAAGHHPDIDIRWNKVHRSLWPHAADTQDPGPGL
jgi:4a-hydroxytetrahydrobiopterin dehydratase